MYSETRKLQLIEDVLKITNEATLIALENFLNKIKNKVKLPEDSPFEEFSGIWSEEEADEISRIIEDTCETIHPDDWK